MIGLGSLLIYGNLGCFCFTNTRIAKFVKDVGFPVEFSESFVHVPLKFIPRLFIKASLAAAFMWSIMKGSNATKKLCYSYSLFAM